MGVIREGPWRGQLNGERIYQAEVHALQCPMGSYHILDGARVKVIYPGNTRTCVRCHSAPSQCPGGGIARECEAKGTGRVPLTTHLKQLWSRLEAITSESGKRTVITESAEDYIGVPLGAGAGGLGGGGGGDEGGDQASSGHLEQVDRLTTDSPPPPPSPSPGGSKDQPGLIAAAAGPVLPAAKDLDPAVTSVPQAELEEGEVTDESPETAAAPSVEQAAAVQPSESAVQASAVQPAGDWADEELDQMTKIQMTWKP